MPFFRSYYSKDLHTEIKRDLKPLSKLFSRLSSPDGHVILLEPRSIPESTCLRRCSTSERRISHKIPPGDRGIKRFTGNIITEKETITALVSITAAHDKLPLFLIARGKQLDANIVSWNQQMIVLQRIHLLDR
jgi:hypothetical protein